MPKRFELHGESSEIDSSEIDKIPPSELRKFGERAITATDKLAGYEKARRDKLFEPVEVSAEGGEYDFDFSYLMGDDNAEHGVDAARVKSSNPELKHDNLVVAQDKLNSALRNEIFAGIVGKNNPDGLRGQDLMALIRQSASLRSELGGYLCEYLDGNTDRILERVPYRVLGNGWKQLSQKGYSGEKVRSREYVARLVLAKVDGTFDVDRSESDPVNIKNNDGLGQHRAAADRVIESLSNP